MELAYFLVPIIAAIIIVRGNFYLQKRLLKIQNKEKALDFLISIVKELKVLYSKYWNKELHCPKTSSEIKITQTQILDVLSFLHKKHSLENKQKIEILLLKLIKKATNEDFDSTKRSNPNPNKSIEAGITSNKIVLELLRNKI